MTPAVDVLMMDAPAGTGLDAWTDDLATGVAAFDGAVTLRRHRLPRMARFFPRALGRWGRDAPSAQIYHFDPWIGPTVPAVGHRVVTVHLVVHGDPRYGSRRGWMRSGWHRILKEREMRAVLDADVVVAVSDHVAERIHAICGRRTVVIPNGIDTDLFHPRDSLPPHHENPRPRVVSVGTASSRKGFDILLGLSAAMSREFEFVHVGPVDAVNRRRAKAAGLDVRGSVDRETVARLMREADLFLSCSRCEGFGLVVAEAMATGLPVVALTIPTTVELVGRDGGVLVDRERELGGALRTAWERSDDWTDWGRRNRDRARARYDRNRMASDYVRLYKELVR